MSRDYSKQKTKRRKRSGATKKQKPLSLPLILSTGIIIGLLIAFLIYLKWRPEVIQKSQPEQINTLPDNKVPTDNQEEIITEDQLSPLEYEYHDILQSQEVTIPKDQLKTNESSNKFYMMPCGSFRKKERAESLKAKIALSGFNAEIVISNNQGEWHRVQLGPFLKKRKAESVRHRLQANEINNCQIIEKKHPTH